MLVLLLAVVGYAIYTKCNEPSPTNSESMNYKEEIEILKKEVFGPKEEKEKPRSIYDYLYSSTFMGFGSKTLKEKVDDLEKDLEKSRKLVNLLLDHLKLEYVKVTEENGHKKVKEKLRKQTKKAKKKKNEDYEGYYDDED
jgi:hypothetical protein